MEGMDFPGMNKSLLGLGTAALFSALQQFISFRRYQRMIVATGDAGRMQILTTALSICAAVELVALAFSPVLLCPAVNSVHLLFLSHYRRAAEHRTGSCCESFSTVLLASSLGYYLYSVMFMALGIQEHALTYSLDFGYIGVLVCAIVPLRHCTQQKQSWKLVFFAILHSYCFSLLKRLILDFYTLPSLSTPTLWLFPFVLLLEISLSGRILDPISDEVTSFGWFFILWSAALLPIQVLTFSSQSPTHSLQLAVLADVLSIAVWVIQGAGVMLWDRKKMLQVRLIPLENQAESAVNTSFQDEEKKV